MKFFHKITRSRSPFRTPSTDQLQAIRHSLPENFSNETTNNYHLHAPRHSMPLPESISTDHCNGDVPQHQPRNGLAGSLYKLKKTMKSRKRHRDPNFCKPQLNKVGFLYKRDGSDYKTKRYFRLTEEGLKFYKTEQDKTPISVVLLDEMRCELLVNTRDSVTPPQYYFIVRNDDMYRKSSYFAAESDYERKKWMVSIKANIDKYCRTPVKELNEETRTYLGINLQESGGSGEEASIYNSVDSSESEDDLYQVSLDVLNRTCRVVPNQCANRVDIVDDELYYDHSQLHPDQDHAHMNPAHENSVDRRVSTTENIFADLDLAAASAVVLQPLFEEDDTYLTAGDISTAVIPARNISVVQPGFKKPTVNMDSYPGFAEANGDPDYVDAFSLQMPLRSTDKRRHNSKPELPAATPPLPPSRISQVQLGHRLSIPTIVPPKPTIAILSAPPLVENDYYTFSDIGAGENIYSDGLGLDNDIYSDGRAEVEDDIYTDVVPVIPPRLEPRVPAAPRFIAPNRRAPGRPVSKPL